MMIDHPTSMDDVCTGVELLQVSLELLARQARISSSVIENVDSCKDTLMCLLDSNHTQMQKVNAFMQTLFPLIPWFYVNLGGTTDEQGQPPCLPTAQIGPRRAPYTPFTCGDVSFRTQGKRGTTINGVYQLTVACL
jgi:hypothetical protein